MLAIDPWQINTFDFAAQQKRGLRELVVGSTWRRGVRPIAKERVGEGQYVLGERRRGPVSVDAFVSKMHHDAGDSVSMLLHLCSNVRSPLRVSASVAVGLASPATTNTAEMTTTVYCLIHKYSDLILTDILGACKRNYILGFTFYE